MLFNHALAEDYVQCTGIVFERREAFHILIAEDFMSDGDERIKYAVPSIPYSSLINHLFLRFPHISFN